jgi:hypothetical protein
MATTQFTLMLACVPATRLFRLLLSLVSFAINDYFLPLGNLRLSRMYRKILYSNPSIELEPFSVKPYRDAVLITGAVEGQQMIQKALDEAQPAARTIRLSPIRRGIILHPRIACKPPGAPKIIFAALDAGIARELEPQFAAAGCAVVSNSSALRMQSDVPLVIPEKMPEAPRLDLDASYRRQLLELFKGILALTRETHIKQLEIPAVGAAAPRRKS